MLDYEAIPTHDNPLRTNQEKLTGHMPTKKIAQEELRAELERGYTYVFFAHTLVVTVNHKSSHPPSYLRRFKTLSRAFATGDFRMISGPHHPTEDGKAMPGPWQKVPFIFSLTTLQLLFHLTVEIIESARHPSTKTSTTPTSQPRNSIMSRKGISRRVGKWGWVSDRRF